MAPVLGVRLGRRQLRGIKQINTNVNTPSHGAFKIPIAEPTAEVLTELREIRRLLELGIFVAHGDRVIRVPHPDGARLVKRT